MIETYETVTGKYGETDAPTLTKISTYVTRGNDMRLEKSRSSYDTIR